MTVQIEYKEKQTEKGYKITAEIDDDDKVVAKIEDRDMYKVEKEYTVVEEQYIVRTEDGMGKESRTYWIKQNNEGDWYVEKCRKTPNRGHQKIKTRGQISTKTVRKALKDKHDIEVVN